MKGKHKPLGLLGKPTFLLVVATLCVACLFAAPAKQQSQPREAPAVLEVSFAIPLVWDNGCLRGGLDIVNRSAGPLFLTKLGRYFAIALDVSKDDSQSDHALEWVNIYGDTDTTTSDVDSLPAGSKIHEDFCFHPTVWVVNAQRKTRREIPVRGKLRVDVSYFASERDWKAYKDLLLESESDAFRLWSSAFAEIPCANATCKPDCNRPPVGIHGESRSLTDIGQSSADMNARGKELSEQLSRKFPPCSPDKSTVESAFPQSTESHCSVSPPIVSILTSQRASLPFVGEVSCANGPPLHRSS
jgi:hypothetical protein